MNFGEAIVESKAIFFNGTELEPASYSFFAEPNESREETQFSAMGQTFTFQQLDGAEYDENTESWNLSGNKVQLTTE